MIKKTIINNLVIYVKLKEIGLRSDYFFNRKGLSNEERGHFVLNNGKIVYNRPVPALSVCLSGSSLFLNISGSTLIPILYNPSSP